MQEVRGFLECSCWNSGLYVVFPVVHAGHTHPADACAVMYPATLMLDSFWSDVACRYQMHVQWCILDPHAGIMQE